MKTLIRWLKRLLLQRIHRNSPHQRQFLLILLAALTALWAIGATRFRYPEIGLDPSWQQALVEATDAGRIFGRELIFTYGPLHQAVTDQVSQNLTPFILGRILFGSLWFFSVWLIGSRLGIWAAATISLAIALTAASFSGPQADVPFYLFSLISILASYWLWYRRRHRFQMAEDVVLPSLFASGLLLATLVKLSYLGAAVPGLVAVFGMPILGHVQGRNLRALPALLLTLLLPVMVLYGTWGLTVNGSLGDFIGYYTKANLEIVKGYTDAMSFSPSWFSLPLLLIGILSFGLILLLFCRLAPARPSLELPGGLRLDPHRSLTLLALSLLAWVVFKSAFVRDDPDHTVLGGLFLVSALILVVGLAKPRFMTLWRAGQRVFLLVTSLPALLLASSITAAAGYWPLLDLFDSLYWGLLDHGMLLTPQGRQQVGLRRQQALRRIQPQVEDYRLPPGSSADVIPWDITTLLANQLLYRPRPIPQSYSAYAKTLQQANRDFVLASPQRPDYLILSIDPIDARLPISLDSPALLSLAGHYTFVQRGSRGSLVLRRQGPAQVAMASASPRTCQQVAAGSLTWSRRGWLRWTTQTLPLPRPRDGVMVLDADFQDSLPRAILAAIYRPFPLFLEYLDARGRVVGSYRLIPKAVHDMLVFPVVTSTDALLKLLTKPRDPVHGSGPTPTALRFVIRSLGAPFSPSTYALSDNCQRR